MKVNKLFIFILAGIAILSFYPLWAEQLILKTYYPAPYGVYKELNVDYFDFKNDEYREDTLDMPEHEEARICYDMGVHDFKYSDGSAWLPLGDGPSAYWTLTGDKLYTNDSTDPFTTWNVGIGTTAPIAALTVDGAIARPSADLRGDNASTHINLDSQIGDTGETFTDTRDCLVLGGAYNRAENNYAIVVGGGNNRITNMSDYSIILGGERSSITYGSIFDPRPSKYSVAAGQSGLVGEYSVAMGGSYQVRGDYAVGLGNAPTTLTADYSVALATDIFARTRAPFCLSAGNGDIAATHEGSFLWADSPAKYNSNGLKTFNISAKGVYYGTNPASWDIAEEMFVLKEDNVQEAEIVSLAGDDILGRSKKAYDENLVGVVTSSRTTSLHLQTLADPPSDELEKRYITLAGRAYVKVNNENGPLKVGDAITSSSTPGIGMKATKPCKIIGYAMEDKDFSQDTQDEVLAFVNLTYYVPTSMFEELEQRIAKLELAVNNQDLVEDLNE